MTIPYMHQYDKGLTYVGRRAKMSRSSIKPFTGIIAAAFIFSGCAVPGGADISVGWENPAPPNQSPRPAVTGRTGPPAHAPAHGYRAKHAYRYYPDQRIYYDTQRSVYFYLEKDGWRISASLPSHITLSSNYVTVSMQTDKPYEYYDEHAKKYPPGKVKKKAKKKGKQWAVN